MINENKFEIRNLGNGGWYWINRYIINRYGLLLRVSGLAVYNVLAYFANSNTQTCFPTQRSIAGHLGISVRTVNRKIRLLKDLKLIRVKKIRGRCLYSLLRVDTSKEIQLCDKRDIRDRTPGKINKNKYLKINNKNNRTYDFNNLKPLNKLIKNYDQKTSKNHRH